MLDEVDLDELDARGDVRPAMSFDSFCPCCNQPTNLSFISVR
jgi:hypothetical protein